MILRKTSKKGKQRPFRRPKSPVKNLSNTRYEVTIGMIVKASMILIMISRGEKQCQ